ncbi:MAG TPA: LysR substrate-binding domain-containing protein [Actinomycetota bacterium]|nr:LysR substrate-binding domain-containing protein [Actinomycetota bacterium]
MTTRVELRQFRYFIAVAEELHFSRAAERLRIAQSGLSQQIKRLERAVGVQLLVRDRRGVRLTDAGHVFLDHARLTLELADRTVTSAVMAERGKTGLLRVGTTILWMPPMAGRLLQTFEDRFPDVEVELHPRLISELIDGISTFALDIAVVIAPFKSVDPPPRYQQLGTYELVAAVPEGHRLAKLERVPRPELLTEPFLDAPRNINPEIYDHIHRILFGGLEHPQRLEVAELEDARRLELVAEGRGIGVTGTSPGVERQAFPGVVFRPLDEDTPPIGYGVAWSPNQTSPFLESFIEVAREVAASETPPSAA